MMLAMETNADEQGTLSSLETFIDKRQHIAKMREAVNQLYRPLIVCATEESKQPAS